MSSSQIPHPHAHTLKHPHQVHFYSDDAPLIHELCHVLVKALKEGQSVVVIATLDHRERISECLGQAPEFSKARAEGRYVALDAAELLSRFMMAGMPDADRFSKIVGNVMVRAASAARKGAPKVVAFGEMVAILCAEGKKDAALRLEELWNQLANQHAFSLYCAYPIETLRSSYHEDIPLRICCAHTGVVTTDEALRVFDAGGNGSTSTKGKNGSAGGRHWHEIENRFQLFVESVQDYAIFMLDPSGNVTSWSHGARRIKGYEASEIIGKNFSTFYPEEDLRSGKPPMELEVAAREGRFEDEGWRIRKDGSKFWANVIITAVRDEAGHLVGFGKVTRDFTDKMQAQQALDRVNRELRKEILDRKLTEQRLAESEKSLRMLSLHLLRTQDEERRRIGRDLHDSLGQVLTAMKLSLASVKPGTQENQAAIAKCMQLADDCIREVRTISYLLYPPMLEELGLKSAIQWYVDGFAERSGIKTMFECSADFDRLPRETELALFRVLQEALTNVHRHSESAVAGVRLLMDGSNAVLQVHDTGKGIPGKVLDQSGDVASTGVGLRGMNERMRQLGGRLEVSSNGRGTTLTAVVPVETKTYKPIVAIPVSA